jgi:1,4-dihydroxy-2-naphthoate octaprenyltransferase
LLGSYVLLTLFVLASWLPWLSLLMWLTFPLAVSNVRAVLTGTDRKAFIVGIKRTSALHFQFGIMFALGLILARFI